MRLPQLLSMLLLPAAFVACGDSETNPFAPGPDVPAPNNDITFEWEGSVAPGDHLEIRGILGDIRAVTAADATVEVFAEKRWNNSDPSLVRVEVVRHAAGVTICAVYPHPTPGRTNDCSPGGAGDTRVGENDVSVDFEIRIPAGVDLLTSVVNGRLDADDLESHVFAATVNGDVNITTTGLATAATVNGDVFASIGMSTWDQDLAFATVNGDIILELPAATNATVKATSVSGGIVSDFPLTIDTGFLGRTASGTLGQGGRDLDLATVNGNIEIRSR